MADGSNGYRADLVSRQRTPGLISSLPETAGLLQFISFSTSYPELDSAVRPLMRRIGAAESTRFTGDVDSLRRQSSQPSALRLLSINAAAFINQFSVDL